MPGKNASISPQKSARTLLILLLSVSGGIILPQAAVSQENFRQLAHAFEQKAAAFNAEKQALLQAATKADFSKNMSIDEAAKTYPFLDDELLDRATIITTIRKNKGSLPIPANLSTTVSVAESRDPNPKGVNIFLVRTTGILWCGSAGCGVTAYADQGAGYKKIQTIITDEDISIARANGQVALILTPPQNDASDTSAPSPVIWMLKNNEFVLEHEPEDQGYVKWKELELKQEGKWQGQPQ